MSFRCEHCGVSNNEIQAAGSIRRVSTLSNSHANIYNLVLHSGGHDLYRQNPQPRGPQPTARQIRLMFRHDTSIRTHYAPRSWPAHNR